MSLNTTSAVGTETLIDWYRRMQLIRHVEDRLGAASKTGELPGPVHLSIGQEAIAVAVGACMRPGDWATSTHRGHGHYLGLGGDPNLLVAEIYGRATGACGGKGGSMHVADISRGILGANGIVGAGIGLATGAALTAKQRKAGNIAIAFFGDGGANEGIFFEAMNLSALWSLPLIFVCENNGWSEFVSTASITVGSIAERSAAFGIPHSEVDGNDVLAAHDAVSSAAARARAGNGPTLLEMMTYRTRGHVESEQTFLPGPYRPPEELAMWQKRDPIDRLHAVLRENGVEESALNAIVEEVITVTNAAFQFAIDSPLPEPEAALRDVFAGERN
ncbi:MAG TPA: thiamine pyrophosphate-dependent dehydrogenase E1 component subunit alpha [Candidatus Dormibacteraeota bacterium]|jgi:pyruvate dehydrogenase E1 component alpha subunit